MAAGTEIFGEVFETSPSSEVFGLVFLVRADPVPGPFCVERVEVYVPGAQRTETYTPGAKRTRVYVAGSQRTEVCS